jgi:ligand-binding sensor domain-containing protein
MDKYSTQILYSCLGDIYCDDNFTWICSSMGGLIRYNGTKFMVWDDENSFLPDDITTITKDNFGDLWIGTQNQGIIIYNPKEIGYDEETN